MHLYNINLLKRQKICNYHLDLANFYDNLKWNYKMQQEKNTVEIFQNLFYVLQQFIQKRMYNIQFSILNKNFRIIWYSYKP